MGAVSDVVNIGDWGRMRMWLLAIAVAIVGSYALWRAGVVDLSKSIYTAPNTRPSAKPHHATVTPGLPMASMNSPRVKCAHSSELCATSLPRLPVDAEPA